MGLDFPAKNFGILIAYVLPGFVTLWGLAAKFEVIHAWLMGTDRYGLTVGGVLYVTAAAITIGMILNAVRWLIIDPLWHVLHIPKPDWDDALLETRLPAFERLVEDHFRYHQFYANSAIGLIVAFIAWRLSEGGAETSIGLPEACLASLEMTLLLSSRDALGRYYRRTSRLLVRADLNPQAGDGA